MGLENTLPSDPRELLQQVWSQRRQKNPALSLRSFARFLKVSPGRLSELLSGKRPLTLDMAEKFSDRLELAPAAKQSFLASVKQQRKGRARQSKTPLPAYHQLSLDAFHVISEWYHFALLNLANCSDFQPSEKWCAQRLGLNVADVRLALIRLERLELIERKGKSWIPTQSNLATTQDIKSVGLRKGHRGILEKAIDALESVPLEARDITNMTMAIDPRKLPQAKQMLTQFRRKMAKVLEVGNSRTQVYTLALQLIPLTKLEDTKS